MNSTTKRKYGNLKEFIRCTLEEITTGIKKEWNSRQKMTIILIKKHFYSANKKEILE